MKNIKIRNCYTKIESNMNFQKENNSTIINRNINNGKCKQSDMKTSVKKFADELISNMRSGKKTYNLFASQFGLAKLDRRNVKKSMMQFSTSPIYTRCVSYDERFMITLDNSHMSYKCMGEANVVHIMYYLIAKLYHFKTTGMLSNNIYLYEIIKYSLTLDAVYAFHMNKSKNSIFEFKPSIVVNNYDKLVY